MNSDAWWQQFLNSDEHVAQTILDLLSGELKVKLLAFDLDLTLLDINTGGKWIGSVQNLARHFRPCFLKLLGAALRRNDFKIAVVTFSVQAELIFNLLKYLFPNSGTERIVIEASSKHEYPQFNPRVFKVGKQDHLARVVQKIKDSSGEVIRPEQIMLFDDRILYTKIAKKAGSLAFWVTDDVSLKAIDVYVEKMAAGSKHAGRIDRSGIEGINWQGTFQSIPSQGQSSLVSVVRV